MCCRIERRAALSLNNELGLVSEARKARYLRKVA